MDREGDMRVVKIRGKRGAKSVVTKSGKVKYASQVNANRARRNNRESVTEIDWATYKPKHKLGCFGQSGISFFTHNQERKVFV
jgi:hypothetical protein